ncbi:MAG: hypothetical protein IAE79_27025, partial [Anaerolinea sp.]|nr:hypothetical protein [Anaerolinea sp.]
ILAGRKKVGFVLWGVSGFLPDEAIAHIARYTYEWAAPGSCLAFNAQIADTRQSPEGDQISQMYERMGAKLYPRPLQQFRELLHPWQMEQDFISLLDWHGFDESELAKEDMEAFGPMGGGFGAYLVK